MVLLSAHAYIKIILQHIIFSLSYLRKILDPDYIHNFFSALGTFLYSIRSLRTLLSPAKSAASAAGITRSGRASNISSSSQLSSRARCQNNERCSGKSLYVARTFGSNFGSDIKRAAVSLFSARRGDHLSSMYRNISIAFNGPIASQVSLISLRHTGHVLLPRCARHHPLKQSSWKVC